MDEPPAKPPPKRRYGTIVRHLQDDPASAVELVSKLSEDALFQLGSAVADEMRRRAVADGNEDAVIAEAFETGFGRDGLGMLPWINGPYIVCPGGLTSKGRSSHRCRFVSVNDTWIWDSELLITESKRSLPGTTDGFRAVALVPIIESTELDVVAGRMRSGQHSVEHVVSYAVRKGRLVEVSQRTVKAAGMA